MNVFVSGANSILGEAIVLALLERNQSVTALVPSEEDEMAIQRMEVSVLSRNLDETESWLRLALKHDAFIHLTSAFVDSKLETERKIIQGIAKNVPNREKPLTLIYTGGHWLFPNSNEGNRTTETSSLELSGEFKWFSNNIRSLQFNNSLALTVIHPAIICSHNQGVVHEMVLAAANGSTFSTSAKATTHWPLVEITDLAELYCKAVEASRFRLVLNACGVPGVAVGELAATVSALVGKELNISTGVGASLASNERRNLLITDYEKDQVMSSDQARRLLKWSPKFEKVNDIVRHSIQKI